MTYTRAKIELTESFESFACPAHLTEEQFADICEQSQESKNRQYELAVLNALLALPEPSPKARLALINKLYNL